VQLPVLRITTDNGAPIVSRGGLHHGPDEPGLERRGGAGGQRRPADPRPRQFDLGHSPKKPYRLKLTDKQSLLGMPSSKDWVLLANYSDKTLLRNAAALDLGARMGFPWTPRSAFVEVYLERSIRRCLPAHGEHQGQRKTA
jgi:hypothetical protein